MQLTGARTYDGQPLTVVLQSQKPVGRGPLAKVLLGQILHNDDTGTQLVAIKVFENMLDDVEQEMVDRERQIARHVASLRHPYILKFIGEANLDSRPAIISSYMGNGHLLQYFKFKTHRGVDKKKLILQVAAAVHYLHAEQGLVHGDIKCANVLVSDSGDALLSDVGLSTFMEKPQNSVTTGTVLRGLCTLRFAAPEILQDTADDGLRLRSKTCQSDVYAFGMLILEAVTERVPWFGCRDIAVIQRACAGQTPPQPTLDGIRASISHAWWNICRSCWALNPADRPPMNVIIGRLESQELAPVNEFQTTETLTTVTYTAGGRGLLTRTLSGTFQLWDGGSGAPATAAFPVGKHSMVVSPDGLQVAYCGVHSSICPDPDGLCTVCRSPSASVSAIRRWDPVSGAFLAPALTGHAAAVTCLAYSHDGAHIVSGSDDGTVRLWDVATGAEVGASLPRPTATVQRATSHHGISRIMFSPDSTCIAAAAGPALWVWKRSEGASWTPAVLPVDSQIFSMCFSPDGHYIFTVVEPWRPRRHTLAKWNIATQTAEFSVEIEGDSKSIAGVAVSPSGRHVATATRAGPIQLRDAAKGEPAGSPIPGLACSVAFSPDGKSLVTGSPRGVVRVWDLVEQLPARVRESVAERP